MLQAISYMAGNGKPGRPPLRAPANIIDYACGSAHSSGCLRRFAPAADGWSKSRHSSAKTGRCSATTREVLSGELGLDDDEMADLFARKVTAEVFECVPCAGGA